MQTIVMTGATSGIGAVAIEQIAKKQNTKIIIGARGQNRVVPEGTEVLPLDMSSLESVRDFAKNVIAHLGNTTSIDILILNAGVNLMNNKSKTTDGFESIFATNHLSHYLLSRLLWPYMAKNGTIIFTTSDTHDPDIVPLGAKTLDVQKLAYPTNNGFLEGMRAYPASKLCNLLTARYFVELPQAEKHQRKIIAYNPGATSGTSLGASKSLIGRIAPLLAKPIMWILGLFNPAFKTGSVERAGEALAQLSLGEIEIPEGKFYASLVNGKITFPNSSKLAQTEAAKKLAWNESATMVKLPIHL